MGTDLVTFVEHSVSTCAWCPGFGVLVGYTSSTYYNDGGQNLMGLMLSW